MYFYHRKRYIIKNIKENIHEDRRGKEEKGNSQK